MNFIQKNRLRLYANSSIGQWTPHIIAGDQTSVNEAERNDARAWGDDYLDGEDRRCTPMRKQRFERNTTNSVALRAGNIWARGRFGAQKRSCKSTRLFKQKRSKTHTYTAQSATEFVVNGGVA